MCFEQRELCCRSNTDFYILRFQGPAALLESDYITSVALLQGLRRKTAAHQNLRYGTQRMHRQMTR